MNILVEKLRSNLPDEGVMKLSLEDIVRACANAKASAKTSAEKVYGTNTYIAVSRLVEQLVAETSNMLAMNSIANKYGTATDHPLYTGPVVNTAHLRSLMANSWAKFSYTKKDGTVREAIGTTSMELIPEGKRPKEPTLEKVVFADQEPTVKYFDLDAGDWRSFIRENMVENAMYSESNDALLPTSKAETVLSVRDDTEVIVEPSVSKQAATGTTTDSGFWDL